MFNHATDGSNKFRAAEVLGYVFGMAICCIVGCYYITNVDSLFGKQRAFLVLLLSLPALHLIYGGLWFVMGRRWVLPTGLGLGFAPGLMAQVFLLVALAAMCGKAEGFGSFGVLSLSLGVIAIFPAVFFYSRAFGEEERDRGAPVEWGCFIAALLCQVLFIMVLVFYHAPHLSVWRTAIQR